jgi:iduronate 2-sulfatase
MGQRVCRVHRIGCQAIRRRWLTGWLFGVTAWLLAMNLQVGSLQVGGLQAAPPNVLLICIDDLRSDLGALGVAHARTPHLDAFASRSRLFSHHYVQVPTCGASRCGLLLGRYPYGGQALVNNAIATLAPREAAQTLPAVFRQNGYLTVALGKVTHYPGGRTGRGWAEGAHELPDAWDRCFVPEGPWKTPQALMHGYANGVARESGVSPAWEAFDGPDESYPDAWVAQAALETLSELEAESKPWLLAVGFFKPHLPFAAPLRWHQLHQGMVPDLEPAVAARRDEPSGWHASGEFRRNYGHPGQRDPQTDRDYARRLREAYAASVSYMDAQLGRLLTALQESGAAERTVVVIWSDHGFLLGEHAIWGKHCLYEAALRSPLMIQVPGMSHPGQVCPAVVETVDVLPTLLDLCGLPAPGRLDGVSLRPQLEDPSLPSSKPALGFWRDGKSTLRDNRYRLIQHLQSEGPPQYELFDFREDPGELRNLAADEPELVRRMSEPLLGWRGEVLRSDGTPAAGLEIWRVPVAGQPPESGESSTQVDSKVRTEGAIELVAHTAQDGTFFIPADARAAESGLLLEWREPGGTTGGRVLWRLQQQREPQRLCLPIVEEVVLLHDNDQHFDFNAVDQFREAVERYRRENSDVFLLNAGDILVRHADRWQVDGESFHGDKEWYWQRSQAMVQLMNDIGYDAMTLGNHEIAYVDDLTCRALSMARFPLLGTNVECQNEVLPPLRKQLTLSTHTGRRIGLIGLTLGSAEGVVVTQPAEVIDTYAAMADQHDIMVALNHLGYRADRELAQRCSFLDVIIGGHSHTLLEEAEHVGQVLVAQAGGSPHPSSAAVPKFLGVIRLRLEDGELVDKRGEVQTFFPTRPEPTEP